MGKRQKRIFAEELNAHLPKILAKELNIILKNDVTLHGKIIDEQGDKLRFSDMLHKKYFLQKAEIAEIIIDEESLY